MECWSPKPAEVLLGVDDELLLSNDSAEKGDDLSSCFRTDAEPEKLSGCDMAAFSRFIDGPIRFTVEADECGLASKADSFFRLRRPGAGDCDSGLGVLR
jgi:hypothetical protein